MNFRVQRRLIMSGPHHEDLHHNLLQILKAFKLTAVSKLAFERLSVAIPTNPTDMLHVCDLIAGSHGYDSVVFVLWDVVRFGHQGVQYK